MHPNRVVAATRTLTFNEICMIYRYAKIVYIDALRMEFRVGVGDNGLLAVGFDQVVACEQIAGGGPAFAVDIKAVFSRSLNGFAVAIGGRDRHIFERGDCVHKHIADRAIFQRRIGIRFIARQDQIADVYIFNRLGAECAITFLRGDELPVASCVLLAFVAHKL